MNTRRKNLQFRPGILHQKLGRLIFLQNNEEYRDKVLESHPELLFMKLNGGMIYQKKKTKKGLRHRLGLVVDHEEIAADFFRDIKEEFRTE